MGNYLKILGLGFIYEDLDAMSGMIGHVLQKGKPIHNYYGLPYLNEHFGSTQIVCRVGPTPEGDKLQFTGFDSHADSLCCWKFRIDHKMKNKDKDDPTRVKLLLKDLNGGNPVAVDVLNGDILPSFKKDEMIELQMIAFAEHADFYADEDAYADTVEPGPNGKKTMIGENTLFPVGFFSDDEAVKDVVQIHGVIKRMALGKNEIEGKEVSANIRCHVDTQLGEIVIILPLDDIEEVRNNENMREGKVINCLARLSGDAAINDYEEGMVKNAENNLKLVAYTLEDGDPKRLCSVAAENFHYHSDSSGKDIRDIDEYIEFVNYVNSQVKTSHTDYATIAEIAEGDEELEYSIGTRCALIRYEGEEGYDAIIFVDTDNEGNIRRILLSREGRYRFKVEDPFPKEDEDLEDMIAKANYKSSIIGRSHFHDLIEREMDDTEIDNYIDNHRDDLEADISDLLSREIEEDTFAEAFLRGVQKSRIKDYKEENIRDIGKQFHKDATFFKSEDVQKETFHDALVLVAAIGRLYKGRWVPQDAVLDTQPVEDRDELNKKRQFNILMALKRGYETGDFESVEAYLTEKSIYESQWVFEPLTGRTDIMAYLRGKGETLKKQDALAVGTFVITPEGPILRLIQGDDDSVAVVTELDNDGLVARIDLCDIHLLVDESGFEQG